jgi:hypothetical protein
MRLADNGGMDVSMTSALAGWASELAARQVQREVSTAVLKQIVHQQERQGEALVQMRASSTPPVGATGQRVDRYA